MRQFFLFVLLFSSGVSAAPEVRIALLGDSITYNPKERAQVGYPQRLEVILGQRTPGKYTVGSYGVNSTTSTSHLSTWSSSIRSKNYQVLVILSGVNDMLAGTAATAAWANIDAVITQALADGLVVVLVTVLPWGAYTSWTVDRQTQTDALNTSIRGRAGVVLVDAYPQFEEVPGNKILKISYEDPDHLHLLTPGSDALATRVAAAIP